MISLEDLNTEIEALEGQEPSYSVLDRLAAMYIVRDKLNAAAQSNSTKQVKLSGSEFLEACSAADMGPLFDILDEHIEAIKVMFPHEYEALMGRIRALTRQSGVV